jgi:hypothetical protein
MNKQLTLQDLILQEKHECARKLLQSGYTLTDYKSEFGDSLTAEEDFTEYAKQKYNYGKKN